MDYLSLVVVLAVVAVVVFAVLGFQKMAKAVSDPITNVREWFEGGTNTIREFVEGGTTIIRETVEKIPYGIEQVVTGKEIGVPLPPPAGTPPLTQAIVTPVSPRGQIPIAREPYATAKGIIPPKPLIVGRLPSPTMGDIGSALSSLGSFLGGLTLFPVAKAEKQKIGLMDMPPDEVLYQIVGDDLTDVEVRQKMTRMPSFKGKQFMV